MGSWGDCLPMRALLMSLALIACGLAAPASAQDEDSGEDCTWSSAEEVSVEQLTAAYEDWDGKCVRVRGLHAYGGYAVENRLLEDRLAILEEDDPHLRSVIVRPDAEVAHEMHRPLWEEVLGIVGSCTIASDAVEAMMRAEPDKIIMLAGLCHYTLDHYVWPLAYRPAEGPPVARLRRAEVGAAALQVLSGGDLSLPHRAAADRMLASIDAGDFDAFLALYRPPLAAKLAELGEAGLEPFEREQLDAIRAEFAEAVDAWRTSGIGLGAPSYLLFEVYEEDAEGGTVTTLAGVDPEATTTWCRLREGVSADELPALTRDIDNDPSRPYFCVEASEWLLYGEGTVPSARLRVFRWGFPESAE